MEGTFSNESIYEKKWEIRRQVYVILLHSVLSKFVIFIRKTEWFLLDQYLPVFRQIDHKRPHFLLRCVLRSVVEGPWKKLMNEFFSEEAVGSQQHLNGCSCFVSRQFCDSTVLWVLRRHKFNYIALLQYNCSTEWSKRQKLLLT